MQSLTAVRPEVDHRAIEAAVHQILVAIGENPEREGLVETPRRVAEAYAELFSGVGEDPSELLTVGFDEEDHHEMVVLRDIPFHSTCEHHLLPFQGVVHIGYIPDGRIVGISKLARLVEVLARRPQIRKPGSRMVTSATRGPFRDDPRTRNEFFALLGEGAR